MTWQKRTYMLASLSTELSNKVTEKLDDSDSFPVVWLQFLKSIQSTSIERFEDLKAIIKTRLPSQYSGENLEQLATHFHKNANELTTHFSNFCSMIYLVISSANKKQSSS